MKIGRNDPCHCGSGKKFKKCCGRSAEAAVVAEVSKIGPQWVHRHALKLLQVAGYQEDSDLDLSTQMVHILDERSQGSYDESELEAKSKKEKEIFKSLHAALGQSILEPLEVLEVRRGYSIKVRGCFTQQVALIEQVEDAEALEPMEWILGRVFVFAKKSYLLSDWQKVPFKKRKPLKRQIEAYLAETGTTVEQDSEATGIDRAWFKQNASWVLQQYKEVVAS